MAGANGDTRVKDNAIEGPRQILLEPPAAIGDPPRENHDWDCRSQRPPDGKHEIGHQAENGEKDPENLALHLWIVVRWKGTEIGWVAEAKRKE